MDAPPLARYANYFRIGHSATEIVIEFCQAGRGDEPAGVQIVERIVLLPLLAAELHGMLGESLQQHLQLVGAGAPADGN